MNDFSLYNFYMTIENMITNNITFEKKLLVNIF